jgi:hypothetical protein
MLPARQSSDLCSGVVARPAPYLRTTHVTLTHPYRQHPSHTPVETDAAAPKRAGVRPHWTAFPATFMGVKTQQGKRGSENRSTINLMHFDEPPALAPASRTRNAPAQSLVDACCSRE